MSVAANSRTAVRSSPNVGKTALLAWVILWYGTCFYPWKVGCTGPTSGQMFDALWPELAMWLSKLPPELQAKFEITSDHLYDVDVKGPDGRSLRTSFAVAKTSRPETPEALQGLHSENMLFLIDEASGVEDVIFKPAENVMASEGAKMLMTGNPLRPSGFFYRAFTSEQSRWTTFHVPASRSPRVSQQYVDDIANEYGKDSVEYRIKVLAEFPLSDVDSVIPYELVNPALVRDVRPITDIMPVWGLDVARFGACRTALVCRQANVQRWTKTVSKRDTMEVAGWVMAEYQDAKSDERPAEILVDSIGVGAGVVDRLRELGAPVRGVNVGEMPSGRDRFQNLKAELWWRCREWFEERDVKLTDKTLAEELGAVQRKFTSSGKIQIEPKEDMIERIGRSPDTADAFILTFAGVDIRGVRDRYLRKPEKRRATGFAI